jgi:hypothetical protein
MKTHHRLPPPPSHGLGLAAFVLLPTACWAQPDLQAAQSVVKITCSQPATATEKAGQTNASGFVWLDKRYVVTTLHAVVGCAPLLVYSESKKDRSPAKVVKVNLEADLALLQLERDLGLAPIQHLKDAPDPRGKFFTWGYPQGVREMTDVSTEFAGGLKRGVTTLEAAYTGVEGSEALLAGQSPKKTASILRVTTTLQPGHSGAPILDREGRVVAIADGGLLGGYRTVNWSIPAHLYLPGLGQPGPGDAMPRQPSKLSSQFSQVTVADTKVVALPPAVQGSATGELRRVRNVTLADLAARLKRENQGKEDDQVGGIKRYMNPPGNIRSLSFDIYEDPLTGATFGVPVGLELVWNSSLRALEARSASGLVRLLVGVLPAESHAAAKSAGKRAFVSKILPLANWTQSPASMEFKHVNERIEWANNANFFDGFDRASGKPSNLLLSITVSGKQLLGYAVYVADETERLPAQDIVTMMMMELGVRNLSGFAVQ